MYTDKDKQGIALVVICAIILMSLAVTVAYLRAKPKADVQTHCIPPITKKTAIVIDYTDPIPEQTRTEMVTRAMRHIESHAAEGELISIFIVSDLSDDKLTPEFSACKPPA